jgi:hypothetical protein
MIYIIFRRSLNDIHEHAIPIGYVYTLKQAEAVITELSIINKENYYYADSLTELGSKY